jgi:hypothetical protein
MILEKNEKWIIRNEGIIQRRREKIIVGIKWEVKSFLEEKDLGKNVGKIWIMF